MLQPHADVDIGAFDAYLSTIGETAFVALRGELDLATSRACQQALRRAERATSGPVVVDLGGLDFIDLCGLRVLLTAAARLDGRLRLLPASQPAAMIFELTGTIDRLPFARA